MSLRDRISAANDTSYAEAEIPEWGVTVGIRSLTVGERFALFKDIQNPDGEVVPERLYPEILIKTVVDPTDRTPVFLAGDEDVILGRDGAVIERLVNEAMRVSGITPGSDTTAGKDSSPSPSTGSSSTSPQNST